MFFLLGKDPLNVQRVIPLKSDAIVMIAGNFGHKSSARAGLEKQTAKIVPDKLLVWGIRAL